VNTTVCIFCKSEKRGTKFTAAEMRAIQLQTIGDGAGIFAFSPTGQFKRVSGVMGLF